MANEITTSKQFTVNVRDIIKGVLVAAISAAASAAYTALTVIPVHIDWKQMGIVGITAGLGYIIKNFFTPAQTVITGKPQPPTE
jgi:D-arabinose 1-dehydrogenase-like Zn-dependent alcohol dehydrogenase